MQAWPQTVLEANRTRKSVSKDLEIKKGGDVVEKYYLLGEKGTVLFFQSKPHQELVRTIEPLSVQEE